MLADYLEEALTQFGKSFEDYEEHLLIHPPNERRQYPFHVSSDCRSRV